MTLAIAGDVGGRARNEILHALPPMDWKSVAKDLRSVQVHTGRVLYEPDDPIDVVYFPQTAVFSASRLMRDGGVAEIAMIGPEGVVGLRSFLRGGGSTSDRVVCSVPGEALTMRVDAFLRHAEGSLALHRALLWYAGGCMTMLAQLIACNRLHRLEPRCARWLLMTADRIGHGPIPLTQERLSMMLGAQRPTVTAVLALLRATGCVGSTRGRVEIFDRRRLESLACECYSVCASVFRKDVSVFPTIRGLITPSIA